MARRSAIGMLSRAYMNEARRIVRRASRLGLSVRDQFTRTVMNALLPLTLTTLIRVPVFGTSTLDQPGW